MEGAVIQGNGGRGVFATGGSATIVGCTFKGNLKSSLQVTDNGSPNNHVPFTKLNLCDNQFLQAFAGAAAVDYAKTPNIVLKPSMIKPGSPLGNSNGLSLCGRF